MKPKHIPLILATLCTAAPQLAAQQDFLALDNRWEVRDFYRYTYNLHPYASMDWSGSYQTGDAGDISEAWRTATRDRIRFFRRMAGVPHQITFRDLYNQRAQAAALMLSVNNELNHQPPQSWQFWSQLGFDGANHSNIGHGVSGADAVTGYIADPGAGNFAVGHRRWFFYPFTTAMGAGDVPGNASFPMSNAIHVIPELEDRMEERQARDEFVAWPPPGYVPSQLVFPRWSFSHPEADFSQVTPDDVVMSVDGQSVQVTLEPLETRRVGEPTLVWVPEGFDTSNRDPWPAPDADETVAIAIHNVLVEGQSQSFDYTVTIFDANQPGSDEFETTLSGPNDLLEGELGQYAIRSRPWAEQTQVRVLQTTNGDQLLDAESATIPFETSTSPDYTPRQNERVSHGQWAFHLVHPKAEDQILTLPGEYVVESGAASLQFHSSLAFATENQIAYVEIKAANEGNLWLPIWSQSGPVEQNDDFTPVSLSLADYAGHAVSLRFRYAIGTGSYFNNWEPHLGWALDHIQISGLHRISSESIHDPLPTNQPAELAFDNAGAYFLQARDIAFDGIPLGWGFARQLFVQLHDGPVVRAGQWTTDATLGRLYGAGSANWAYAENFGWVYLAAYPWIHSRNGWIQPMHGSLSQGLWLYHERHGFIYTALSLNEGKGWYWIPTVDLWSKFSPDF